MQAASEPALRIDRWLWCVRFFKSRSMAAQAVAGGHVRVNGQRAKPSKDVRVGDVLSIAKGAYDYEVCVRGIPSRRGPAAEAIQCYEELESSILERERRIEQRRAALTSEPPTSGRPDKRTRRLMRNTLRDQASPQSSPGARGAHRKPLEK